MYKQGEILLIPLPFTDLSSQKKRPVLVLSNNKYNLATDDVIVAAITSNVDTKPYIVPLTNNGLSQGTLKVDSCVRADKIYTLSQSIIIKSLGQVKVGIINVVKEKIDSLME
jgi:mRNA interferase MazF